MKKLTLALAAALVVAGCTALSEPTDRGAVQRSQTTPVEVFGSRTWLQADAGYQHTCALDTDGKAWCWGSNEFSQLGVLTGSSCPDVGTCARRPIAVLGDHQFVRIASGLAHSCALTAAGAAWCWGGGFEDRESGFLGNGFLMRSETPVRVVSDSVFVDISAGYDNTCALTAAGQAWCWGRNAKGEGGNGSTLARLIPTVVPGVDLRFTQISVGGEHVCAVRTSGAVTCWGSNRFGQLGVSEVSYNDITRFSASPLRVDALSGVTAVAAGADHTCALQADGTISCWGININAGQLGDSSGLTHRGVPGPIAEDRNYASLAAGFATTCAVSAASGSYCWGSNFYGAVGIGSRDTLIYQTPRPTLGGPFVSLTGGGAHMCGITADQRLFCWGDRRYGQVGN
jgi:alpha-tubulin suppressor-like RCC1 family protein